MTKKNIFIGFIIGILANIIGVYLYTTLFLDGSDFMSSIKRSLTDNYFTKIVSIGAVLNVLVFFIFIMKQQDLKARGVLLATLLVAFMTFVIKFT